MKNFTQAMMLAFLLCPLWAQAQQGPVYNFNFHNAAPAAPVAPAAVVSPAPAAVSVAEKEGQNASERWMLIPGFLQLSLKSEKEYFREDLKALSFGLGYKLTPTLSLIPSFQYLLKGSQDDYQGKGGRLELIKRFALTRSFELSTGASLFYLTYSRTDHNLAVVEEHGWYQTKIGLTERTVMGAEALIGLDFKTTNLSFGPQFGFGQATQKTKFVDNDYTQFAEGTYSNPQNRLSTFSIQGHLMMYF